MLGRIQIREVEIFVTRKYCNRWKVCGKRHGCCDGSEVLLPTTNFTVCRRLSEYCNATIADTLSLNARSLSVIWSWYLGEASVTSANHASYADVAVCLVAPPPAPS
jgi:hypothetical protein